jgi:hypothetical protein
MSFPITINQKYTVVINASVSSAGTGAGPTDFMSVIMTPDSGNTIYPFIAETQSTAYIIGAGCATTFTADRTGTMTLGVDGDAAGVSVSSNLISAYYTAH